MNIKIIIIIIIDLWSVEKCRSNAFNPSNIPLRDEFQLSCRLGQRDGDCGSIITAHVNVIIDIIVQDEFKLPYLRKARHFPQRRCARCFSQVRDWTSVFIQG